MARVCIYIADCRLNSFLSLSLSLPALFSRCFLHTFRHLHTIHYVWCGAYFLAVWLRFIWLVVVFLLMCAHTVHIR